jgi:hypothetical protein
MSSGGNQSGGYHGGSTNPDREKYRKFLDDLYGDDFPGENTNPPTARANTGEP